MDRDRQKSSGMIARDVKGIEKVQTDKTDKLVELNKKLGGN